MYIHAVDNQGTVFFAHEIHYQPERQTPDTTRATSDNVRITVYGSEKCEECIELKRVILPQIQNTYKDHEIEITFLDIDIQKNYDYFKTLELRSGITQHTFPTLHIGDELLSSDDLTIENIEIMVKKNLGKKKNLSEIKPFFLQKYVVLLLIVLMLILFLILVFRYHKNNSDHL